MPFWCRWRRAVARLEHTRLEHTMYFWKAALKAFSLAHEPHMSVCTCDRPLGATCRHAHTHAHTYTRTLNSLKHNHNHRLTRSAADLKIDSVSAKERNRTEQNRTERTERL